MKNILMIVKIALLAIFGILGILSLFMFPSLIGHEDAETSIIGYSYLGLLLTSITVIYFIAKKYNLLRK